MKKIIQKGLMGNFEFVLVGRQVGKLLIVSLILWAVGWRVAGSEISYVYDTHAFVFDTIFCHVPLACNLQQI